MRENKIEELIEKENITKEEVERILQKIKEGQCAGGFTAFKSERKGAMEAAFEIMEAHPNLNFSEAMSIAWYFIKKQREEPCELKTPAEPVTKQPEPAEAVNREAELAT